MPLVDLPLAQLRAYHGINPCPVDFDDYWARGLRELEATPPEVELVPSTECVPADAECFDLWFTGVGGARIYAKYIRPKKAAKPHPAVLQFHGYWGNSGAIAAMDCRGQGGKSEDRGGVKGTTIRGQIIRGLADPDPDKLLFRQIFLDTVQLARVVMGLAEVDANRVGCFGISQGGALSLACAALEPRIRRTAPVYPFLCDYQRVWEMDLAEQAYEELRMYFRHFDPTHEREEDIFTKLGYIDVQHLAPRIRADVLMFTGLMDKICPPSTQFAAYNKIRSGRDMVIYPDFGHEVLPGYKDRIFSFMQGLGRP
jgi:cephalosporin-C deacetylase